MIDIFTPSDLDAIVLAEGHRGLATTSRESMVWLGAQGFAWTSWATSENGFQSPLAILCAAPVGAEECEVFIFPSATLAKRNPFTLFKDVSAKLADARKRFKTVRSITRPDAPAANRFLAHLGFVREGMRGEFLTWVLR